MGTAHHMLLFGCEEPGQREELFSCGEMGRVMEGTKQVTSRSHRSKSQKKLHSRHDSYLFSQSHGTSTAPQSHSPSSAAKECCDMPLSIHPHPLLFHTLCSLIHKFTLNLFIQSYSYISFKSERTK